MLVHILDVLSLFEYSVVVCVWVSLTLNRPAFPPLTETGGISPWREQSICKLYVLQFELQGAAVCQQTVLMAFPSENSCAIPSTA